MLDAGSTPTVALWPTPHVDNSPGSVTWAQLTLQYAQLEIRKRQFLKLTLSLWTEENFAYEEAQISFVSLEPVEICSPIFVSVHFWC